MINNLFLDRSYFRQTKRKSIIAFPPHKLSPSYSKFHVTLTTYHKMNNPSNAPVGDPIWWSSSGVNLFALGFMMIVATREVAPPTKWTGPSPATSTTPILLSQPCFDHTQWAGKQKTNVLKKEKMIYARYLVRSAIAPAEEHIFIVI